MENVSMEKVIDGKSIRALTNGDKIENDIFCVERKFDEYWVFLKYESSGLFLLGCSPLVSEAREIMGLFMQGCLYGRGEPIRKTKMLKIKFDDVFSVYKLMDMQDGDILENHIFRVKKEGNQFLVFRKSFVTNSWWCILGVSDTSTKAHSLMCVFYEGVSCCTKGYVIEEDNV